MQRYLRLNSPFLLMSLALFLISCQTPCDKFEPVISCPIPVSKICGLPSAFPPLTEREKNADWGRELLIGENFAREWDLYRAITCYKRAKILVPSDQMDREQQIDYNLILCYYLGNKAQEALNIFESSELSCAGPHFPAFNNLLLIVFDCYQQTKQDEKAECVMQAIHTYAPEVADDLMIYWSLKRGDMEGVRCFVTDPCRLERIEQDIGVFNHQWKSPSKARTLNAILPGAGYYYVGQKNSAVTSFLINALFIGASYELFRHGYPAAGIITASLETGWYFGGINGAGLEAQAYNARLYEGVSQKIISDNVCFPIFMFETSF